MNVIFTLLALLTFIGLCGLAMYWAFKPLLDEQKARHEADRQRWATERERFKRWSQRGRQ